VRSGFLVVNQVDMDESLVTASHDTVNLSAAPL
jgi:hypothetical protein